MLSPLVLPMAMCPSPCLLMWCPPHPCTHCSNSLRSLFFGNESNRHYLAHVLSLIKDDNWSDYATPCLNPWKFPITPALKLVLLSMWYRPYMICPSLTFECHHPHSSPCLFCFTHTGFLASWTYKHGAFVFQASPAWPATTQDPFPATPLSQVLAQNHLSVIVCDHPVWRALAVTM